MGVFFRGIWLPIFICFLVFPTQKSFGETTSNKTSRSGEKSCGPLADSNALMRSAQTAAVCSPAVYAYGIKKIAPKAFGAAVAATLAKAGKYVGTRVAGTAIGGAGVVLTIGDVAGVVMSQVKPSVCDSDNKLKKDMLSMVNERADLLNKESEGLIDEYGRRSMRFPPAYFEDSYIKKMDCTRLVNMMRQKEQQQQQVWSQMLTAAPPRDREARRAYPEKIQRIRNKKIPGFHAGAGPDLKQAEIDKHVRERDAKIEAMKNLTENASCLDMQTLVNVACAIGDFGLYGNVPSAKEVAGWSKQIGDKAGARLKEFMKDESGAVPLPGVLAGRDGSPTTTLRRAGAAPEQTTTQPPKNTSVTPAQQAFRDQYKAGKFEGDGQYASALFSIDGGTQRRAIKILGKNDDGSLDIVMEKGEGDFVRMTYPRGHLGHVRVSGSSKEVFSQKARARFKEQTAQGRSLRVLSKSGNEYQGVSQGIVNINGKPVLSLKLADGSEQLLRVDKLNLESLISTAPKGTVSARGIRGPPSSRSSVKPSHPIPKTNPNQKRHVASANEMQVSGQRLNSAMDNNTESFYGNPGSYWRQWSGATDKINQLPQQGWKVHISANLQNAGDVADTVLPILRQQNIPHKVVGDLNLYQKTLRNSSDTQAGKFITFYPRNEEEARQISRIVSNAISRRGFRDSDFIPVPGEERVGPGVYGRYGRIFGDNLKDRNGVEIPNSDGSIMTPDGRLVPDVRGQSRPDWVAPLGG